MPIENDHFVAMNSRINRVYMNSMKDWSTVTTRNCNMSFPAQSLFMVVILTA